MSLFDKVKEGLEDVQAAVADGIDHLHDRADETAGHLQRTVDEHQTGAGDHVAAGMTGTIDGLQQHADHAATDAATAIDDVQRETSGHLSRLGHDADTAAADLRQAADTIEHSAHAGIDDARAKVDHAADDARARLDQPL